MTEQEFRNFLAAGIVCETLWPGVEGRTGVKKSNVILNNYSIRYDTGNSYGKIGVLLHARSYDDGEVGRAALVSTIGNTPYLDWDDPTAFSEYYPIEIPADTQSVKVTTPDGVYHTVKVIYYTSANVTGMDAVYVSSWTTISTTHNISAYSANGVFLGVDFALSDNSYFPEDYDFSSITIEFVKTDGSVTKIF